MDNKKINLENICKEAKFLTERLILCQKIGYCEYKSYFNNLKICKKKYEPGKQI